MPRRSLLSRVANRVRIAEALPTDTRIGALAARMLRDAVALDIEPGASPATLVGSSMLDIVAALLDSVGDASERSERDTSVVSLERVRRYALDHLGDTNLSVDKLARVHGVSCRTLNRLFAPSGTTPMRWIWQQRLLHARKLLSGDIDRRVTDVAFECGFREAAHFSRSFKARFGASPASLSMRKGTRQGWSGS